VSHCRWHWSALAYRIFRISGSFARSCSILYQYSHTPSRYPNDPFTNDMRKPEQRRCLCFVLAPIGHGKTKLPAVNVLKGNFRPLTGEITCSQQILYQLNVTEDMLTSKCNGDHQFHVLPTQPQIQNNHFSSNSVLAIVVVLLLLPTDKDPCAMLHPLSFVDIGCMTRGFS
jgi:hypothetical protein